MLQHSMLNSDMKQKILELIRSHPRHYTGMIRRNTVLREWVESRSHSDDDWRTRVYAATHGIETRCPTGNHQKVVRWSEGLTGCGPASRCACVKTRISQGVQQSKQGVTSLEQQMINQKRQHTMLSRYGVPYNSQRKDIQHLWRRPRVHEQASELLSDPRWLTQQYVDHHRTLTDIGDELGVYYGTVAHWARQHGIEIRQQVNRSQVEEQIARWIRSRHVAVIQGDWTTLGNQELDLLLPWHQLAIEVNDLFWHSWNPTIGTAEDRERHAHKRTVCEKEVIRLIQITDWHWLRRQDAVKGVLMSALGLNTTVGARKTRAEKISPGRARKFMDQNHLAGFCPAREHWALTQNDDIMMCMSVGRSRFGSGEGRDEIVRLASQSGVTVVGGFSRLLKAVDRPLMSYVDLDWFSGRGYAAAGFIHERDTGPGYFWTDGNDIISRYRCRKSRLKEWLPGFDASLSESENLFRAGYRRFWNSGNSVWIWNPITSS